MGIEINLRKRRRSLRKRKNNNIGEGMKGIDKLELSMRSLRNTVIFGISLVVTIYLLNTFVV